MKLLFSVDKIPFVPTMTHCLKAVVNMDLNLDNTVSIHCAPEISEIDCIGRIESFRPKFVRGW